MKAAKKELRQFIFKLAKAVSYTTLVIIALDFLTKKQTFLNPLKREFIVITFGAWVIYFILFKMDEFFDFDVWF